MATRCGPIASAWRERMKRSATTSSVICSDSGGVGCAKDCRCLASLQRKRNLSGGSRTPAAAGGVSRWTSRIMISPAPPRGVPFPYGIYDQGRNTGFVLVGTSAETAAFAVEALRTWWLDNGRWCYPQARRWLIEADCGGATGNRLWAWKAGLQELADAFGVTITVAYYPPGASKWNRIEHRMFNLISLNWSGQPLKSYDTVLNYIRTTSSSTGFR